MPNIRRVSPSQIAITLSEEHFDMPRVGKQVIYEKTKYRVTSIDSYYNGKLTYVLSIKPI